MATLPVEVVVPLLEQEGVQEEAPEARVPLRGRHLCREVRVVEGVVRVEVVAALEAAILTRWGHKLALQVATLYLTGAVVEVALAAVVSLLGEGVAVEVGLVLQGTPVTPEAPEMRELTQPIMD